MKRNLLFLISLFPITLFGQVKFGPELGVNMAMMNHSTKSELFTSRETSKLSPGLRAGLNMEIKIAENFYIQSGAFYVWNNIKFTEEIDYTWYNVANPKQILQYKVHSLQIPLYALYKSGYEGNGRFFIGVGPYFGYTFSASQKTTTPSIPSFDVLTNKYRYHNLRTEHELKLGDNSQTDQLFDMDYGAAATMGYESNVGLFFRGNFNYGLANLTPGADKNNFRRNWGFGLTLGVVLGKDGW